MSTRKTSNSFQTIKKLYKKVINDDQFKDGTVTSAAETLMEKLPALFIAFEYALENLEASDFETSRPDYWLDKVLRTGQV